MHSNEHCGPGCFNSCLEARLQDIEAGHRRAEFGAGRRDDLVNAAFFDVLGQHYRQEEESRPAEILPRRPARTPRRIHYRVAQVTGAESLVVKRGRKEFELRLCSVRVPDRFQDEVASALSELLLLAKIDYRLCCRDSEGVLRGVVVRIDPEPGFGVTTVNDALIACGFGHAEARCTRCSPPASVPASSARRNRKQFIQYLHDRAARRADYILGSCR